MLHTAQTQQTAVPAAEQQTTAMLGASACSQEVVGSPIAALAMLKRYQLMLREAMPATGHCLQWGLASTDLAVSKGTAPSPT
jgi:hypothetical protein